MTLNKTLDGFSVAWSSPSNIAIVKYWGKLPGQIPASPSVSMTLDQCRTNTEMAIQKGPFSVDFSFEGNQEAKFAERIKRYLTELSSRMPWINDYSFVIKSENSFPHSTGIASSASAFSALALCLTSIQNQITPLSEITFYKEASLLARLGSGSACRSIYPGFAAWGQDETNETFSDHYATPIKHDSRLSKLVDTIIVISQKEKRVSSSKGHSLMTNHPYAEARFLQARHSFRDSIQAIANGNIDLFNDITISEGLTLHSLMLSSTPPFMLFEPETVTIINLLLALKSRNETPFTFTLDAGPNIHLIYDESDSSYMNENVIFKIKNLFPGILFINDKMGGGPTFLGERLT